ncbi:hypothetical protein M407DRAFT_241802 [Tulasnella calospora MUT 4182]|uniref:HNH nuclease domain-containing protein n=1 Tax=Tulasnella calospora MUT 4182 TaxID=1051891 RepID=A0A0C3QTE0_9AGAM|nr:hypothetical protein M407DRAFT_241802 [Tulasnella calospora MUT 4182]
MSLTSSSVDGGYPLSVSAKESVRHHLGERCIVCGYPAVTQVAHIIPRSVQSNAMLYAVRRWSPVLATFRKNQIENLLLLCPNHHAEYDQGMFTIVPVAEARAKMKEYEIQDFQRREGIVRDGHADPGRTFVQPSDVSCDLTPRWNLVSLRPCR